MKYGKNTTFPEKSFFFSQNFDWLDNFNEQYFIFIHKENKFTIILHFITYWDVYLGNIFLRNYANNNNNNKCFIVNQDAYNEQYNQ